MKAYLAYLDLALILIGAVFHEGRWTVFTIKDLEKCEDMFFLKMMYAPESTIVVLTQRMQQWQRAMSA